MVLVDWNKFRPLDFFLKEWMEVWLFYTTSSLETLLSQRISFKYKFSMGNSKGEVNPYSYNKEYSNKWVPNTVKSQVMLDWGVGTR